MRLVCLIVFFAGLCHSVSKATECTARGRYPNNDVENCRGYTMCLLGGSSGFTQYKLTCPLTFVYSHLEQQCTNSTSYQCLPSYTCNTTGNFENHLSNDCSSYVACAAGISGIVTARQVACPSGEVFNPLNAACVNTSNYICNAGIIITTESVTEISTTTEVVITHNATYDVQVSGENGFVVTSSVTTNSAVDVCNKHALLFALLVLVIRN